MSRRSGVTLIEILIAISLLSLLSGGILVAMHLGLTTLDKTDQRMVRNRRVVNARKIIENEIDGFISTFAETRGQDGSRRLVVFFQGEAESLRFVSSFSLQDGWRGRAQITALQVIPGENGQGVRLIVNETPWTGQAGAGAFVANSVNGPNGQPLTQFAPIVAGPQSFVLADRLRYCRFSYLEALTKPPFQLWGPQWVPQHPFPLGIRIEMAPLDANGTDLRVTTVTMPLSVNLFPGTVYSDGF